MLKDVVVFFNCNNYCILAIYFLRTGNKLTKAYREAELLSCLCLVGVLANTPGGVKRSGLGAHAVGFLVVY